MAKVNRRALDGTSLSIAHNEEFLNLVDDEHEKVVPEKFTDTNRPDANLFEEGEMIWNTTSKRPNFADPAINRWRDAVGTLT